MYEIGITQDSRSSASASAVPVASAVAVGVAVPVAVTVHNPRHNSRRHKQGTRHNNNTWLNTHLSPRRSRPSASRRVRDRGSQVKCQQMAMPHPCTNPVYNCIHSSNPPGLLSAQNDLTRAAVSGNYVSKLFLSAKQTQSSRRPSRPGINQIKFCLFLRGRSRTRSMLSLMQW